ncbi:MAG: hypothetical protein Q9166_005842 [cf. Caloplaca sp. 2 TL-2023]
MTLLSTRKSGDRLVLNYNLVQQASCASHIPSLLDDHKRNRGRIEQMRPQDWIRFNSDSGEEEVVFVLDHEYSKANLCINQLKGKDQMRMRYLSETCRVNEFCLLFAHIGYSRFASVDDDNEFIEELESSWKLKTFFKLMAKHWRAMSR